MSRIQWHIITAQEALVQLGTSEQGLSSAEIQKRISAWGKNILPGKKKQTLFSIVLHQFISPLIYVLLAAALFSLFLGEYADAGFISAILVINAVIGATQEWKAESKASSLQELIRIDVKVKRGGIVQVIDSEGLVAGDIVFCESGNKVPADIRILTANNLTTEEAILTGESLPVKKNDAVLMQESVPVAERANILFAGTTVTTGRCTGVVVATGVETEIGQVASSLKEITFGKAPLVERMEVFAKRISVVVLISCVILGIIGYSNGIELKHLFFFIVAVAVSAIPEGLPIAMTVALSIGATRMARRNVIIRKLTAVEGLGSCTYIATDKTGTLTVDQQTAKHIILSDLTELKLSGEGYNGDGSLIDVTGKAIAYNQVAGLSELIDSIVISNEAYLEKQNGSWQHRGDPIDIAMLASAYKSGSSPSEILSGIEKVREIPFESSQQYSLVYYRSGDILKASAKGAIEKIANVSLDKNHLLVQKAIEYAENGYRVIAVSGGVVNEIPVGDELPTLELLGIVALIDPLRPEARQAVTACRKAGVRVGMITGDHPATALAIAMDVGIATSRQELISGKELEEIINSRDGNLQAVLNGKQVFARVSPQQKQMIVNALRDSGHFIAVTGDGVNDAPALKTANIGVAMGYGTDVAKDNASIIINDNNFASIVAGIEEGRFVYSNLRKIIYLLISTGAAELLMIALSLAFKLPLPFLPVQLLWLNLVTNGIQDISLAFEAGEKEVMSKPPRKPQETIFDPLMVKETVVSASVISLFSFGLWYHLLYHLGWEETHARNAVLLLMVLLQNFHVLNCRSETISFFKVPVHRNYVLIVGVLASQLVHILAMHVPLMQDVLSLHPVSFLDWIKALTTASLILLIMEGFKWFESKRVRFPLTDTGG